MTATTYFRAQAYNNAWANHRLLIACESLPVEELTAERAGFFPSILHTLNHILTVDWYCISGLEGNSLGAAAFDLERPCTGIAELSLEQRRADRRQVHAVLSGTHVPPPQLDEFFLDHEKERALRAQDFETLGFNENEIWG